MYCNAFPLKRHPPRDADTACRELSPQEDSPFLGEIRPGSEQASICNGLFRAPIFKHYVSVFPSFLLLNRVGARSTRPVLRVERVVPGELLYALQVTLASRIFALWFLVC